MDMHNVSNVPEFVQILSKQKQTLRNAQFRKGQKVPASRSSDEITSKFLFRLMMGQSRVGNGQGRIQSSFIPPAYTPCVSQLSNLKKILVKDLLVETHHRGSYLLLRPITPPDTMTGIFVVVEDENRQVLALQLYHQEMGEERVAEHIFQAGRACVIKEPYLKLMSDGEYGLRVDHLSDFFSIPANDERIPTLWRRTLGDSNMTVDAWKSRGNDCFKASKYHGALECYAQAILCSPTAEEAHIIRLNRCIAFLKTKQFDAALSELEFVPETLEKALFRKAQALYQLRRYRQSCETLKTLLLEYPNNTSAKAELSKAVNRCLEQQHAKYQFRQFYDEARALNPPHLDHSTYIGPIAIRKSHSRGRGLFTTKAVKAGDLLLCEKAFAHAFVDTSGSNPSRDIRVLMETETDRITVGSQSDLISAIIQKIYRNPSVSSVITDLHHGSYKPVGTSEIDGTPVVDSFLIQRIVSLNCFGCPLSSRESYLSSFGNTKKESTSECFHSCGIWPMASYINHGCYSNVRRAFIGDMMLIRATQDLPPDTEIIFWYQVPEANNYEERQKTWKHWSFECQCVICQDEKATSNSVLIDRKGLRAELTNLIRPGMKIANAKIKNMIAKMVDSYNRPASEVPRLSVWDLQFTLAQIHMSQNQMVAAIESALDCLTSLGYVIEGGRVPRTTNAPIVVKKWGLMMDMLVDCWMILSNAYGVGAPDLSTQAEHYARISYKICVGEDETFEDIHG